MHNTLYKNRKFRLVIALILCISFCSTPINVFALGNISTQPMLPVPTAEQAAASVSAASYSISPSHLYPFIYEGSAPSYWSTIDTTNCIVNHLYVHNSNTNQITSISNTIVTGFTTTADHLFYITANQTIIQTDYNNTTQTALYQADGQITSLDYFDGMLSFIENGSKIVILDVLSKEVTTALNQTGLCSVYFFDTDKLIWTDENYVSYYYNTSTQVQVRFATDYELDCFLAPYITPNTTNGDVTPLNNNSTENDISFPLSDYPANPSQYESDGYKQPLRYFNNVNSTTAVCNHAVNTDTCKRYASTNQCDGFAVYAHEKYIHYSNSTWGTPYRPSGDTDVTERCMNTETKARNFFSGLSKGAFIRYGRLTSGVCAEQHSAVFVSADTNGVWVYECNQDERCGVFYTYYSYAKIASRYHCVRISVNHIFDGTKTQHSATKHKQYCRNCSGYLIQSHTVAAEYDQYDANQHKATISCCNYTYYAAHTFTSGSRCTLCGYLRGSSVNKTAPNLEIN